MVFGMINLEYIFSFLDYVFQNLKQYCLKRYFMELSTNISKSSSRKFFIRHSEILVLLFQNVYFRSKK